MGSNPINRAGEGALEPEHVSESAQVRRVHRVGAWRVDKRCGRSLRPLPSRCSRTGKLLCESRVCLLVVETRCCAGGDIPLEQMPPRKACIARSPRPISGQQGRLWLTLLDGECATVGALTIQRIGSLAVGAFPGLRRGSRSGSLDRQKVRRDRLG